MRTLCEYGCGNEATVTLKNGRNICGPKPSSCPINKDKNRSGCKKAYQENRKGYTYNPNSNWAKGKTAYDDSRIYAKYDSENLFVYGHKKGPHKAVLIKERGYRCECCGLSEWMNKPIALELDHVDGNKINNKRENLRLLCPNCHANTPTYRGRNAKNSSNKNKKYSDEFIVDQIPRHKSFTHLLKTLNMSESSNNHKRIKRLMNRFDINFDMP